MSIRKSSNRYESIENAMREWGIECAGDMKYQQDKIDSEDGMKIKP
jgi:hypothetical protein